MASRTIVSWSTGKDSAWALHEARQRTELEIVGILTTVTDAFRRVSMHGVREELLEAQARALRLPLFKVPIPYPCPNTTYEEAMRKVLDQAKDSGVTQIVFGDLFLRDVREYRETKLAGTGFEGIWPLWGQNTRELAHRMVDGGLSATIICLDPKRLPREFAGRAFDRDLLRDLPPDVDPCAENGEFHTFAWGGPMFTEAVRVRVGETVDRDGFIFTDLLPASDAMVGGRGVSQAANQAP
jgi:uncharacterized protein (TIGR00290 family)